jgi:diguanylate cyclase (GGDEF) domain
MDIKQLWKFFLYAGVGREEYNRLVPRIREENRTLLKVFSQLAGVMLFLLYIASMLYRGFATVNSTTYFLSGIVMLVILACAQYFAPKTPALVTVLVYVFEIVLYGFGIRISMLHADKPAVSAVAFLLVSPLLFYDRPSRLSGMIAAVAAVFCTISVRFKAPEIVKLDVWNTVTFAVVAVVTTVFIMSIKIRALQQSSQIEHLSQTDLLTGVKNRNYYEERLQKYPEMCASNLICVYADVNGLHEINNEQGHLAGDQMLHEVAASMQRRFGPEHTYRVGGDEFVAFRADGQPEEVLSEVDQLSYPT